MTPTAQAERASEKPPATYFGLDAVDRALFQDRFIWNTPAPAHLKSPDPTGADFWYLGSFGKGTHVGIRREPLMSPEMLDLSLCPTGTLGNIVYVSDHAVTVVVARLVGTNAFYNPLAFPACRPALAGHAVFPTAHPKVVELEPFSQPEPVEAHPTPTSATAAGTLRELTELPVRDLAMMMGVSERAFNNWLVGEPMSVENERRLLRLRSFLQTIKERGQRPRTWLLTPEKPTGQTRLDLIANARADHELLNIICAFEVEAASNFAANVARLQEELLPNPVELSASERANLARRRQITRVRPVTSRNG